MYKRSAAAVVLYLISFLTERCEATDGTAVNAVTTICTEIHYLKQLEDELKLKQLQLAQAVETLADEHRQLNLAATRYRGSRQGTAYALLTAVAGLKAAKAATQRAEATAPIESAQSELARRRGQLEALRHIYKASTPQVDGAVKGSPGSTLFSGENLRCNVDVTFAVATATECEELTGPSLAIKQAAQQLQTQENYKGVPDNLFKPPKVTNDLISKGSTDSSMDSDSMGKACSDSGGRTGSNGIGIHTATLQPLVETVGDEQLSSNGRCTEPAKTTQKEHHINRARTAGVLCQVRQHLKPPQAAVSTATAGNLASDPDAQTAALLLTGEPATEENTDKRQAAVTKLLGEESTNMNTKFFEPLTMEDVALKIGSDTTKTSIKKAAAGDLYAAALAHFTAEAEKRTEKATKSVTAATQAKEEDCKGKKGASCTGGCELDGEICKPKKKAEKEDGKTVTTNTTGSNSFVINRAPLWVAVLLF
uniref:Variant surface glycoprotein 1125.380 n=1 Tax=Trypanosoma brucei TaxID=5691 RepID=A0A1J0R5T1_9TRYP|nr:variant surface glycoprotein 1125.380 [Trypanosoma brucei]